MKFWQYGWCLLALPTAWASGGWVTFAKPSVPQTAETRLPEKTPQTTTLEKELPENPVAGKDNWRQAMARTWHEGRYELLIPLYAWHNRHFYSREKIRSFNEIAWGIGVGKYRDTATTTHGWSAMVFRDSHNDWEPFVAYTWQRNFYLGAGHSVAIGGFAGLTARSDIGHYTPIPAAWPYVSWRWKNFSLQGMYFPGRRGNGNIAFFWAKYRF